MKRTVLFICIHNSARSQMAEALLSRQCGEFFNAESAGLEPGRLNSLAVAAMQEIGIDISKKKTRSVADVLRSGANFDCVITVCDEGSAAGCPVFPGGGQRLHWSFPDPSAFTGSEEGRLERTREVRDLIANRIADWCKQECTACESVANV